MHKSLTTAGAGVLLAAFLMGGAAPAFADATATPAPTATTAAAANSQYPASCFVLSLSSQWSVYPQTDILSTPVVGKLVINTEIPCDATPVTGPDQRVYYHVLLPGNLPGYTPEGTVVPVPVVSTADLTVPAVASTPKSVGWAGALVAGGLTLMRMPAGDSQEIATLKDGDPLMVSQETFDGPPTLTGVPTYRYAETASGQTGYILDQVVGLIAPGSTAAPQAPSLLQKAAAAVKADAAKVKASASKTLAAAKAKAAQKATSANPLTAIATILSLIPAVLAGLFTLAASFLAIRRPGVLAVWRRLARPIAAPASIAGLIVTASLLSAGAPWWSWVGLAVLGLVVGFGVRTAVREFAAKHPALVAKIGGLRGRAQSWAESQASRIEPDNPAPATTSTDDGEV
jgi:hypothetical protein